MGHDLTLQPSSLHIFQASGQSALALRDTQQQWLPSSSWEAAPPLGLQSPRNRCSNSLGEKHKLLTPSVLVTPDLHQKIQLWRALIPQGSSNMYDQGKHQCQGSA